MKYKYLFEDADRHGNTRRYFRRRLPGSDRTIMVRIYSQPGTDAFVREFAAAIQLHGFGFFSMTSKDKRPGTVYFAGFDEWVKIGFTGDLDKRLAELQTACPVRLIVYAAFPGIAGYERSLHRRFRDERAMGEWFKLGRPIKAFIDQLGATHVTESLGNTWKEFELSGATQIGLED